MCPTNNTDDAVHIILCQEFPLVVVTASLVRNTMNFLSTSKFVRAYTVSFTMAQIVCCEGPKSSLLHCCIFPVARYLRVAMTFSSGEIALFLAVGLEMASRTTSVTNMIPSLSRRYLLISSASLKSFKTSLLSRKTLGRRSAAATAMLVYCRERVSGFAVSPYSTSHPALTFTRVSGADCSTYGVFAGFRTCIRHFDSLK